jgi:hypothetical protein
MSNLGAKQQAKNAQSWPPSEKIVLGRGTSPQFTLHGSLEVPKFPTMEAHLDLAVPLHIILVSMRMRRLLKPHTKENYGSPPLNPQPFLYKLLFDGGGGSEEVLLHVLY